MCLSVYVFSLITKDSNNDIKETMVRVHTKSELEARRTIIHDVNRDEGTVISLTLVC